MRRAIAAVIAVLLVGVSDWGAAAGSDSYPAWNPRPRLDIDLLTAGYLPRVVKGTLTDREFFARFNPSVDPSIFENYDPQAVFIDENTLAVYFVRGIYNDPEDEQNSRIVPKAVRLHVFLLDATTGALIAKREFPSVFRRGFNRLSDSQSTLTSLDDGRFLIHADNRLMLFNRDFQLIHERDLSTDARMVSGGFVVVPGGAIKGYAEMWAVFVAPAGKTALLQHTLEDRYFLEWLDPNDLATVSSQEIPNSIMTASNDSVSYRWFRSIRVLSKVGNPSELCSAGPSCAGGVPWVFLSVDQLLVPRQRSFLVYSLCGDILWSRKGKFRGNGIAYPTPSLDGNRFVVPIAASGGGLFGEAELKKGENFLVYDAQQTKLIFQVHLAKGVGTPRLSSNGSRLALLVGTDIAIYDLPGTG